MNIVLWVVQVLAGLAFFAAGALKVSQPLDKLSKQMAWINSYSPAFVRLIGAAELLGGIGLIVPAALGILPWLTPVAAVGLAIIMVGAVYYHLSHNEANRVAPTIVLLLLVALIAVGRFAISPING